MQPMAIRKNFKSSLLLMNKWQKIQGIAKEKLKFIIGFHFTLVFDGSFCRYLLLPLICSERAWAYAMQLKSKFVRTISIISRSLHCVGESNTEPRKKFHLLGRLRKAVKHAEQLELLCNQQKACDARTKLEVQVNQLLIKR